jgi:hypothetical protein
MHEMEGPRRVLLPCGRRSLGVHRPCRTCSSCSDPAIARLTRSRNGVARCGLPVPIARVQLLRGAVAPPTWPRSLGTRHCGTASPRPASIARDSSSRGQFRRATGRLLACPHLGTHHLPRKPAANCGLPLLAAPRKSPSGPVPVPGDKEISSGRPPCPTRAFRQHFPRVLASTGQSTGGGRLSPETRRCPPRHPPVRPQPPPGSSTIWTRSAHPEADRLTAYDMDHHPVRFRAA